MEPRQMIGDDRVFRFAPCADPACRAANSYRPWIGEHKPARCWKCGGRTL